MLLGRRAKPAPPLRLDELLLCFELLLWFEPELVCFGKGGELRLLLPRVESAFGLDRNRRYFRLGFDRGDRFAAAAEESEAPRAIRV